jgi:hypothetical protein
MSDRSERAIPVGRARVLDHERGMAVVLHVDATEDPTALAVLQARLHEPPDGARVVYGYDLEVVGLGAWVGDRRLRLTVWPALLHADGEITDDGPEGADADLLVIDIDPLEHGAELTALAACGRVLIAGPEAGPTPLALDLDPQRCAELIAQVLAPPS